MIQSFIRSSNTLVCVAFALLLVGCQTPPAKVVEKIVVVYTTVPEELTQPCIPERAIARAEYLEMDLPEREEYLTFYTNTLYKVIAKCNTQLKGIQKIQGAPKP